LLIEKVIGDWKSDANIIQSTGRTFKQKPYVVGKDALGRLHFFAIGEKE